MWRANARVQELLEQQIAKLRGRLSAASTVTQRVESVLIEELAGTPIGLGALSRRLHMSSTTLKRKLAQEGEAYSSVLDRLRHRTALRLLAQRTLSIGEVAYLTGYKDVTAFNKAFRRWTGRSPSEHRKTLP